jgi:hypothetical protein
MATKIFYFQLNDHQISLIKASIYSLVLPKIIINRAQVNNFSDVKQEGFMALPLNATQQKQLDYAYAIKSDLELYWTYHQLKDIAKLNFDIEIDISSAIVNHQVRKKIPRN